MIYFMYFLSTQIKEYGASRSREFLFVAIQPFDTEMIKYYNLGKHFKAKLLEHM